MEFYSKVYPQEFDDLATKPLYHGALVNCGGIMIGIGVLVLARIIFGESDNS